MWGRERAREREKEQERARERERGVAFPPNKHEPKEREIVNGKIALLLLDGTARGTQPRRGCDAGDS